MGFRTLALTRSTRAQLVGPIEQTLQRRAERLGDPQQDIQARIGLTVLYFLVVPHGDRSPMRRLLLRDTHGLLAALADGASKQLRLPACLSHPAIVLQPWTIAHG